MFSSIGIYDANGTKLKKTVSRGTVTEYAGNYIYENGALQFFSTPEGYATPNGMGGYDYVYQYKDHLGNVRLSYTDVEGNLEIVEENNYYPFGLRHKGYNSVINGKHHPYTYNGKEEQEELGLNWLDYGWRNYDPALGRWINIDPLAEDYHGLSPYSYVSNSPLISIDPDGRFIVKITGDNADEATNQLNQGSNLEITRGDDGKLSITGGEAITAADKKLQAAIENKDITVNINATSEPNAENGKPLLGGAFMGSKVNEDGSVDTFQTVDSEVQGNVDRESGRGEGVGAVHEVLESFVEGERAFETQTGSPDSTTPVGRENYLSAHNAVKGIDPRYSANPVKIGMSERRGSISRGVDRVTRTISIVKPDGTRKTVGTKKFIKKRWR
ncbi:RHS repeat-associated core domain-containing protein [Flagellimonas sp.]|uniref:RHS repeat-associated core domain-containing protein n=1 Tax=Flagellimonas sp. TaxID=2058762 RepID=UPI003BABE867